jgi:hypothetical protein
MNVNLHAKLMAAKLIGDRSVEKRSFIFSRVIIGTSLS